GGQISLARATITNTAGPALVADGLRADSSLFMRDTTITGTADDGAIQLPGAHIGGEVSLARATITNTAGPALRVDRLRTDSDLVMSDTTITGTAKDGAIRLIEAHIGGT
ncbi:hypothetical protein CF165_49830, partial [Amycolatopsis vastitatis]